MKAKKEQGTFLKKQNRFTFGKIQPENSQFSDSTVVITTTATFITELLGR